jgi:tetratricopeptide (TPR) repeat protein
LHQNQRESEHPYSFLFSLDIVNYDISKVPEFNICLISDIKFPRNLDYANELKKGHVLMKWSAHNLRRKLNDSIQDISEEEKNINLALGLLENYNDYHVGYDVLSGIFNLGKFYSDKNIEKADFYFDKLDIDWAEMSDWTFAGYCKSIGECYFELKNFTKAKHWLDKGLNLSPKLSVKSMLKKIEQELNIN